MALPTYPLTLPAEPGIKNFLFNPDTNNTEQTSPFTGNSQRGLLAYHLWEAAFTVPDIGNQVQAEEWVSFITKLYGIFGNYKMVLPGYTGPSTGYAGPTPLVNGASQTGNSLILDGMSNTTSIFAIGNRFTVNDEMLVVREPLTSDGGGAGTVVFDPPLKVSPANNDPLEINAPYFIAASQIKNPQIQLRSPYIHGFRVTAREVLAV